MKRLTHFFFTAGIVGCQLAHGANAVSAKPMVQRVVSPGGIVAWLRESHHAPTIAMRFSFKGGNWHDPENLPGVANIVSYLFNEGAGDLNTTEFSRRLKRIAVGFAANAGPDYQTIKFNSPRAHSREAFELLRMALLRPRFDRVPFMAAKRQSINMLRQIENDPTSQAVYTANRLLYGNARLSRLMYGTEKSIAAITVADIKSFRRRSYARDTLNVAVSGAISARELAPILDHLFGSLPRQSKLPPLPRPIAVSAGSEAKSRNQTIRMNIPQSIFVFRNVVALPKDERQRIAAKLVNHILGAPLTGRLFIEVREKRGLVYSIATGRQTFSEFGLFGGAFSTGQSPIAVRDIVMSELRKFATDGPTAQEINIGKSAFLGAHFLGLEGNGNVANSLLGMMEANMPITSFDDFRSLVKSVTAKELKAAARYLIRPDQHVMIMVGKQANAKAHTKSGDATSK